jgi:DNA-binding MarR family transcriptional regulator
MLDAIVGSANVGRANNISVSRRLDLRVNEDDATPALLRAKPTWLISQVATRAHRLLTERLAAVGARGYHYRLLAALAEFGPSSQAGLGRHTGMDRSDVVAAVGELAAQGFVERAADAADRRRNVVTMTPAGVARLTVLDGVLAGVQDELLAPLSGPERASLTRLLTLITGG